MTILMPDVSHYQGAHTVDDWRKAKRVISAIMFKATQGVSFIDPEYHQNVATACRANLPYGHYHFVDATGSGKAQARHMLDVVRRNPVCRSRFFCVDWEQGDKQTAEELIRHLVANTHVPVLEYSGAWARTHGGVSKSADGYIVPEYGTSKLRTAFIQHPLVAWQYTNGALNGTKMPSTIPGIGRCDVSVVFRKRYIGLGFGANVFIGIHRFLKRIR